MTKEQENLYEACALINMIQEVKTEDYINWNISDTEEYINNLLIAFLGEKYNEGIAKKLISELIDIFYTDKMLTIKNEGDNQIIKCGKEISLLKQTRNNEDFFVIYVDNRTYFLIDKNELMCSEDDNITETIYDEDGLEIAKRYRFNSAKTEKNEVKTIIRCREPYEVKVKYFVNDKLIKKSDEMLSNYNMLDSHISTKEFEDLLKGKSYYENEEGYRYSFMPVQIPKYLPKLKKKTEKAYDELKECINETRKVK